MMALSPRSRFRGAQRKGSAGSAWDRRRDTGNMWHILHIREKDQLDEIYENCIHAISVLHPGSKISLSLSVRGGNRTTKLGGTNNQRKHMETDKESIPGWDPYSQTLVMPSGWRSLWKRPQNKFHLWSLKILVEFFSATSGDHTNLKWKTSSLYISEVACHDDSSFSVSVATLRTARSRIPWNAPCWDGLCIRIANEHI